MFANSPSLLWISSSNLRVCGLARFVTTMLIAPADYQEGGKANWRAIALLAHRYFGSGFGTVYDISTILILGLAGASAMAGLPTVIPTGTSSSLPVVR